MTKETINKLLACALACGLFLAGQPVFAHDLFKSSVLLEGTGSDNAITISHGCET